MTMALDLWISKVIEGQHLAEDELQPLCEYVKEILIKESNVQPVNSPVTVFGDIHSQFRDLMKLFQTDGHVPETNFIFMVDFVDRGYNSLEVFTILLLLKARYPAHITLLRGDHESRKLTQAYGFYDVCQRKYGNANAWRYCADVFDFLTLSAIIDGTVLCVHSGLRHLDKVKNELQNTREMQTPMFTHQQIFHRLPVKSFMRMMSLSKSFESEFKRDFIRSYIDAKRNDWRGQSVLLSVGGPFCFLNSTVVAFVANNQPRVGEGRFLVSSIQTGEDICNKFGLCDGLVCVKVDTENPEAGRLKRFDIRNPTSKQLWKFLLLNYMFSDDGVESTYPIHCSRGFCFDSYTGQYCIAMISSGLPTAFFFEVELLWLGESEYQRCGFRRSKQFDIYFREFADGAKLVEMKFCNIVRMSKGQRLLYYDLWSEEFNDLALPGLTAEGYSLSIMDGDLLLVAKHPSMYGIWFLKAPRAERPHWCQKAVINIEDGVDFDGFPQPLAFSSEGWILLRVGNSLVVYSSTLRSARKIRELGEDLYDVAGYVESPARPNWFESNGNPTDCGESNKKNDKILIETISGTKNYHLVALSKSEREIYDYIEEVAWDSCRRNLSVVVLLLWQSCNNPVLYEMSCYEINSIERFKDLRTKPYLYSSWVADVLEVENYCCKSCHDEVEDFITFDPCAHTRCNKCTQKLLQMPNPVCPECKMPIVAERCYWAKKGSFQGKKMEKFKAMGSDTKNWSSKIIEVRSLCHSKKERDSEDKVIVVSHFGETIMILDQILSECDIYAISMGVIDRSVEAMKENVRQFSSADKLTVLLTTFGALGTLGVGLYADDVIMMEPCWDGETEDMALKCVQGNDARIVKLVSENTIEEMMIKTGNDVQESHVEDFLLKLKDAQESDVDDF